MSFNMPYTIACNSISTIIYTAYPDCLRRLENVIIMIERFLLIQWRGAGLNTRHPTAHSGGPGGTQGCGPGGDCSSCYGLEATSQDHAAGWAAPFTVLLSSCNVALLSGWPGFSLVGQPDSARPPLPGSSLSLPVSARPAPVFPSHRRDYGQCRTGGPGPVLRSKPLSAL